MSSALHSPLLDVGPFLARIVLSPILTGPLLLAATYAPEETKYILTTMATKIPDKIMTATPTDLSTTKTVLRVVVALGIVRLINKILNTMASNSWRITKSTGWDWPKEIAVVTGGSSGIGAATVDRLVGMGMRVAVLDVQDMPKAMQTNNRVRFYHCDVTSAESVGIAADAVRKELGHPTILINNAGITKPMPILKMPENFLRRIFSVNCLAHWFTVQQFLPRMIQVNKGHVITIASLASFIGLPGGADYAATKAGALAFHESLTSEIKHHYKSPNVRTTIVHPDFVNTPLIADIAEQLKRSGVSFLTSDVIADGIINGIKSRRGGQIIIPARASIASGLRGMPTWIQEALRDFLGRASTG